MQRDLGEMRTGLSILRICQATILAASLLIVQAAVGQVPRDDILVGHTYPGSGFLGLMGLQMKAGLEAAFAEANAGGGIHGRRLKLISMDDGFSEERFTQNVHKLVTQDNVAAVISPVGTNQIAKLRDYAMRAGVPVVGARAGPDSVRTYNRFVFFNHASFNDEVEFLARHLSTIGIARVSVAYINLPFGLDLRDGFSRAAGKYGLAVVKSVQFASNGEDAPAAAKVIAATQPQAVLLLGGGSGGTQFVKQMIANGVKARTIYGVSVLSVQEVIKELGPASTGIVVSQVMPSPAAEKVPIVKQYRRALAAVASGESPSSFGLEAYISGRVFVEALRRIKGPMTREAIVASMEGLGRYDLGGFTVTYDALSHHGARFVHLAIISSGHLVY
jgi:branched-chain amino acid transport system substrate-binding protein